MDVIHSKLDRNIKDTFQILITKKQQYNRVLLFISYQVAVSMSLVFWTLFNFAKLIITYPK
jgi:uncharacterized protein YaaW (UPF0174 family)